MKLLDLMKSIEYSCNKDISDIQVENITTSQKKISSNTLFVIIKSISFDINKIVSYVLSCKPVAVVCDYDILIDDEYIPIMFSPGIRRLRKFLLKFFPSDFLSFK